MNPFVAALHDSLTFCPSGCGPCIGALRDRIRVYAGPNPPTEWQILASLHPAELVDAPHWEQRLRHLLWKKPGDLPRQYPHLDQIIMQWLQTSQQHEVNRAFLPFIDFLVWDMCHKLRVACNIEDALYEAVVRQCTETAAKAAQDLFGQVEFDSLVESLLIIRNTDGFYHNELANLLKLPWPDNSRTGHILRTSLAS